MRRRIEATTKRLDEKLETLKEIVEGEDRRENGNDSGKERADSSSKDEDSSDAAGKTTALDRLQGAKSYEKLSRNCERSKRESSVNLLPLFDAAAPAVEDSDSSDEEDDEDHAFDHPSTYVDQRWIWLPKDTLGLSEFLTQELKEAGVEASDIGATMDDKGVVEVSRNPPDEEWSGGHDL
jgi:hypothetical protein